MAFFKFTVPEDSPPTRLDKFLAGVLPHYSRSFLVKCRLSVNGISARASKLVRSDDEIEVAVPALKDLKILPENIPLQILYEDSAILVIDKPAGMVAHPTDHGGHVTGTLVNALLHYLRHPAIEFTTNDSSAVRPGLVHRLDRETSGTLVIAKTDAAKKFLSAEFEQRRVGKKYLALVAGKLPTETGRIDAPIARHPIDRTLCRVAETADARSAVTEFSVLESFPDATLVSVNLLTGRTHQIRVHFASIGHPVLGDKMYGKRNSSKTKTVDRELARQFLHAESLSFTHPETRERVTFTSPLPADLRKTLEGIRNKE